GERLAVRVYGGDPEGGEGGGTRGRRRRGRLDRLRHGGGAPRGRRRGADHDRIDREERARHGFGRSGARPRDPLAGGALRAARVRRNLEREAEQLPADAEVRV